MKILAIIFNLFIIFLIPFFILGISIILTILFESYVWSFLRIFIPFPIKVNKKHFANSWASLNKCEFLYHDTFRDRWYHYWDSHFRDLDIKGPYKNSPNRKIWVINEIDKLQKDIERSGQFGSDYIKYLSDLRDNLIIEKNKWIET